jgi:hypothetical protein
MPTLKSETFLNLHCSLNMKKLIIPIIALSVAVGACKSKTNSSDTDTSHIPVADTAGTKKDSLKDTSKRVKMTTPAGAANTPGATGIGGTSPRNTQ